MAITEPRTIDTLTPIQRQIVHAPLHGEIVVGGAAGSGKTTAAIHRAAHLCDVTPKRHNEAAVLFLCFNNALREAIQRQIAIFPDYVWKRTKVQTLHKWCAPYVRNHLPSYTVIERDSQRLALVREAIRETQHVRGRLDIFERDPQVFLEEIRLIKGCGLRDVDEYTEQRLLRTGELSADDYAALFEVAQTYERLLRGCHQIDFDDFTLIALATLEQSRSTARYDHVIIDEAQDLSERQITLGRRLARQSLLLIADQAQAIYRMTQLPDTLTTPEQCGVVLPESFRTTAEIFARARQLLTDTQDYPLPARHGAPPEYHAFRWSDQEAAFIATAIRQLLGSGVAPDEIAVLARFRALLQPIAVALQALAIPIRERSPQPQEHAPGVQLLSIHEAKGHEFDVVFVPGLIESVLPCVRPEMDRTAIRQELALARRQLYVAMTRARHQLFLTSSEGMPSRLLYEIGFGPADGARGQP